MRPLVLKTRYLIGIEKLKFIVMCKIMSFHTQTNIGVMIYPILNFNECPNLTYVITIYLAPGQPNSMTSIQKLKP